MSLVDYRRKRSFDKTGEPGKPIPKGSRAIFAGLRNLTRWAIGD